MGKAKLAAISPFFPVTNMDETVAFYRDKLGFEVRFRPPDSPWFAILGREGAQIFFKEEGGISPVPNYTRHEHLRWDAFIYVADPDALAVEFSSQGVKFTKPLKDTTDGLRGFELADPNGYIIFFGRPLSEKP